jgi:hypothetical protein
MSKTASTSSYDVSFIVEGYQLSGVTDVDGSYSITETPINVLGFGYSTPTLTAPFQGDFNINRNMVSKDALLPYTGDVHLNGAIKYKGKTFGFTSGYLSNYSISCAVGQVPSISNQVTVLGEIVPTGMSFPITETHPAIQIPQQVTISIYCTCASTNRVSSFSYSVSSPREPIYALNDSFPVQVNLNYPLEIDANFTLEIDDYEAREVMDYLVDHNKDTIEILIKNPSDNSVIESYSITNPELIGESIAASNGSDVSIELSYKGYQNR